MADHTKIEWTDATWNPITGCTLVSEGCRNCYAAQLAATRLKHHPSRAGLARLNGDGVAKFIGEVRFNAQWLDQPLHWKKPRMIFVCAHGDLFHESVPDEWIDLVFAVMALSPHHIFQVLTKRPERMRQYIKGTQSRIPFLGRLPLERIHLEAAGHMEGDGGVMDTLKEHGNIYSLYCSVAWPLPNVWLGTSVEDQATADARIPDLLATPAAVRWVSAEPLLGTVDLRQWQHDYGCGCGWGGDSPLDYCRECGWKGYAPGKHQPENCPECQSDIEDYQACPECDGHDGDGMSFGPNSLPRLDWVVAGGESGRDARPMHPAWIRSLRDQCAAASVPFLFKQWGSWAPLENALPVRLGSPTMAAWINDVVATGEHIDAHGEGIALFRASKAIAGRMLDGVEHNGFPEARHG